MRFTKDIIRLRDKLESVKKDYLMEQKKILVNNSFCDLQDDDLLTNRYYQGKIDSIDDTLYIINQ